MSHFGARVRAALLVSCCCAMAGCMPLQMLKGEGFYRTAGGEVFTPVDWAFVQSVGGLVLGDPYVDQNDILWVPLLVDFSGRNRISVEPTLRDSGLKCLRAGGGHGSSFPTVYEIRLELMAIAEDRTDIQTFCEGLPLRLDLVRKAGRVPELMTFRVYYQDSRIRKHFVGEFRFPGR